MPQSASCFAIGRFILSGHGIALAAAGRDFSRSGQALIELVRGPTESGRLRVGMQGTAAAQYRPGEKAVPAPTPASQGPVVEVCTMTVSPSYLGGSAASFTAAETVDNGSEANEGQDNVRNRGHAAVTCSCFTAAL